MRQHFPAVLEEIGQSAKIVGLRNLLVHEYWTLDTGKIWEILAQEIKPLRDQAEALIERAESERKKILGSE